MPDVGDKVYLIYHGYVQVKSVDNDGTITFNYYGREERATRAYYRTLDRIQPYIDRGYIIEDCPE